MIVPKIQKMTRKRKMKSKLKRKRKRKRKRRMRITLWISANVMLGRKDNLTSS